MHSLIYISLLNVVFGYVNIDEEIKRIIVICNMGDGKSSLLNSLSEGKRFEDGHQFDPVTQNIDYKLLFWRGYSNENISAFIDS